MEKRGFWPLLIIVLLLSSCTQVDRERQGLLERMGELEPFIYADTVTMLNSLKAGELMNTYLDFAELYAEDTLSPEFLFKAAELAMNLKMPGRSIEVFQLLLNRYPDHSKAPYSLFMQAFIHENQLNQYDTAKALYQRFVDQYPHHELAGDARVSMDFIGLPLDELIKSWEKAE